MKKIYSIFMFLLLLGTGSAWAQEAVVTSVANPIRYEELLEGRGFLLSTTENSQNKYAHFELDYTENKIPVTAVTDPTTITDVGYIFYFEKSGTGYKIKCEKGGVTYYMRHPSPGWLLYTTTESEATVFTVTKHNDTQWLIKSSYYWQTMGTPLRVGGSTTTTVSASRLWTITPVNATSIDLTYNLTLESTTKTFSCPDWIVGAALPTEEAILPNQSAYVSAEWPTGNASEDNNTFNLELSYTDAFPFTPSTSVTENTTWYKMKLHNKYLAYTEGNHVPLSSSTPQVDFSNQWCFVGNLFDGFKIYNRRSGAEYILASAAVGTNYAGTYPIPTLESSKPVNAVWDVLSATNGFYLRVHGSENLYMNDHANNSILAYWTGTGDGSKFVVEVAPTLESLQTTVNANVMYTQAKVTVIEAGADVPGFPSYAITKALYDALAGTDEVLIHNTYTAFTQAKPVMVEDGFYYIESQNTVSTVSGYNFDATPIPSLYDDIENEGNPHGLVLLNNPATRTAKYVWKAVADVENSHIHLTNSRGTSPFIGPNSSAYAGITDDNKVDFSSITYGQATASVATNTFFFKYFHSTKQNKFTLGNVAYNSDTNPAFVTWWNGTGYGNEYRLVKVTDKDVYEVVIQEPEEGIVSGTTLTFLDEGYTGYATLGHGGFYAFPVGTPVSADDFSIHTEEGFNASVTEVSKENKRITITVTAVAGVTPYALHILSTPVEITPTVTYEGTAHDGALTLGDGENFPFITTSIPTEGFSENDFTINNEGDALKWYTRSFSVDNTNHAITLTYTPIMPEAGKTYRMRAAVSGRYLCQDKSLTTAEPTTVEKELGRLFTIVESGGHNYIQIVSTGKYIDHWSTPSASPSRYVEFFTHSLNAVRVKPNGKSNLFDNITSLDGNSVDDNVGCAWLFEEVRTATTDPMAEAAQGYGTFCLDFRAIVPEGVVRYPNTPVDDNNDGLYTMKWNDIEGSMPANTAVLIEGVAGQTYTFYETEREPTAAITDNAMSCTREDAYDYYALAKPDGYDLGFYKYTGTLLSNRGYIRISKEMAANIRGFIFEDGSLTGIEDVNTAAEAKPEVYYDLTGRRVTKPTKGIYVVNGKKVIINK